MNTVRANPGALSDVMLFAVHLDPEGRPVPARPEWDLAAAVSTIRKAGATPWLTVVNDVVGDQGRKLKDSKVLQRILENPAGRRAHAGQVVALAMEAGFAGVDIDYENLDRSQRDIFSMFIAELAKQLKSKDLELSVTVQPKRSESRSRGPGAADWTALCRSADRLQIMMYNLHNARTDPGPVATSDWIDQVLDYALMTCGPDRIVPALKVGGFDWGKSQTRDSTFLAAAELLDSGSAERHWDRKAGSPFITYDRDGERRIAYFEDRKSLQRKIRRIGRRGLGHVVVWSLGREDPELLQPAIHSPREQ